MNISIYLNDKQGTKILQFIKGVFLNDLNLNTNNSEIFRYALFVLLNHIQSSDIPAETLRMEYLDHIHQPRNTTLDTAVSNTFDC